MGGGETFSSSEKVAKCVTSLEAGGFPHGYKWLHQRTLSCNQVRPQLFFLTKVLITFESVTVDLFYEFFLKDIATKVFLRRV